MTIGLLLFSLFIYVQQVIGGEEITALRTAAASAVGAKVHYQLLSSCQLISSEWKTILMSTH